MKRWFVEVFDCVSHILIIFLIFSSITTVDSELQVKQMNVNELIESKKHYFYSHLLIDSMLSSQYIKILNIFSVLFFALFNAEMFQKKNSRF